LECNTGMSILTSSSLEGHKTVGRKIVKTNTGSILVLDDDFDINNLFKRTLQKQGYSVFCFTDPFLALEHFKINQSTYSLAISDLKMPSMSGFQFLQNIKLVKPNTKVLLMSSFDITGGSEFSTQSKGYEIDGYIQKPVSIKKLNGIIGMYMMPK
jgi:DNA-binding NtrC family response regulator